VHVARMGRMRNLYKIFLGAYERENNFGDVSVDLRIMLKWTLEKSYLCVYWI